MNPRRSATLAVAFYPTVVIAGWAFVSFTSTASPRVEKSAAAAHVVDRLAPSLTAAVNHAAAPEVTATAAPQTIAAQTIEVSAAIPATADVEAAADLAANPPIATKPDTIAASAEAELRPSAEAELKPFAVAALGDPAIVMPEAMPPVQAAISGTVESPPLDIGPAANRIELVGECLVVEPCIDQYLFALYERTPKEDTIKEIEKRQVTVKRKGKMVTVTRSFTKLVENDFTWKDPKAAERIGMSMSDYVIGGMDKSFKMKLFYMLQAAENAGLQPGITSAFRDDYRQSIAAGLKAAANRSYHGGSLRGGYGKGLAADITSVSGGNRAQRWKSTEALWKWVDANGKQYGIGRPYLAFDPPHVGPIDGPEYASRRGGAKTADAKKRHRHAAAQAKPAAAKRQVAAKPASRKKPAGRLAEAR
jgi:hypothetical protein